MKKTYAPADYSVFKHWIQAFYVFHIYDYNNNKNVTFNCHLEAYS